MKQPIALFVTSFVLSVIYASSLHADFLKVSPIGLALPASAQSGSGPQEWACTYDTQTQLIWEIKSQDPHLRNLNFTYSWFDSKAAANAQGDSSSSSNCAEQGRCDTEKFVADVNNQSLCGARNWRLPTLVELKSLIRCNGAPLTGDQSSCSGVFSAPTLDLGFFPYTPSPFTWLWTQTTYEDDPKVAWYVDFNSGSPGITNKFNHGLVRLVRNGKPIANVADYTQDGLLRLTKVNAGNQTYAADLKHDGDFVFRLLKLDTLATETNFLLPEYSNASQLLTIPAVNAGGHYYRVTLQYRNGVFTLANVEDL